MNSIYRGKIFGFLLYFFFLLNIFFSSSFFPISSSLSSLFLVGFAETRKRTRNANMLKGLVALLIVSCAIAVASADFAPYQFAGIYRDSRFGGFAYLCNTNLQMQGSASGQLFFSDTSNTTEGYAQGYRPTLSGNYYSTNAGPTGDVGTYELVQQANGDYIGWYFRNGKASDAWPWVLNRINRFNDQSVPSGLCLDSQQEANSTLNSQWLIGSSQNTLQLCVSTSSNKAQGTIFNAEGNTTGYIFGKVYDNSRIFIGRQYQAFSLAATNCSDFGNAIYRLLENNGVFTVSGFVTRGSLANNPQVQFVEASQEGAVVTSACNDAKVLRKCESGVYFPELRSSASAVVSSLFAVAIFAAVAVLF